MESMEALNPELRHQGKSPPDKLQLSITGQHRNRIRHIHQPTITLLNSAPQFPGLLHPMVSLTPQDSKCKRTRYHNTGKHRCTTSEYVLARLLAPTDNLHQPSCALVVASKCGRTKVAEANQTRLCDGKQQPRQENREVHQILVFPRWKIKYPTKLGAMRGMDR